MFSSVLALLIY